jgi:AAA family ATP:ADP antiporter
MMSVVVVTVLVFVYNKLIDMFPNHQLFYIVGGTYCALFTIIGLMLSSPTYGIYNTVADPYRPLGWISYCAIESFGSIGVSLFWAFANTVYDLESAKKSYGLMVACAQLGSIAGPTLVTQADSLGVPMLYLCGAGCMALMVVMVWSYVQRFGTEHTKVTAADEGKKKKKKKSKAGMLEGLYLFWQYTYVKGITACSCIFMIEVTILDYAMKVLAKDTFEADNPGDPIGATKSFAAFMGVFGQCTNGMSFLFSLVGTSFVIRRFGLKTTIMLFPTLCLVAMVAVYAVPTLPMVFLMMLVLKALSYALNNPCKELLYQPTSDAVKFKAKSWIDIFGQRGSKALGSVVTNQFSDSAADLLNYGSGVAIGLTVWLLYISNYMGKAFDEYIDSGFIVGADKEEEQTTAAEDDTSCGIETDEAKSKEAAV